ncbi:unnamed protein product, partial [Scytosiphon promiscuus]
MTEEDVFGRIWRSSYVCRGAHQLSFEDAKLRHNVDYAGRV